MNSPHPQSLPTFIRLTSREVEVLYLTAQGKTRKEISVALLISDETVKAHLCQAREKLGARNKTHAVTIAIAHEIMTISNHCPLNKDEYD